MADAPDVQGIQADVAGKIVLALEVSARNRVGAADGPRSTFRSVHGVDCVDRRLQADGGEGIIGRHAVKGHSVGAGGVAVDLADENAVVVKGAIGGDGGGYPMIPVGCNIRVRVMVGAWFAVDR